MGKRKSKSKIAKAKLPSGGHSQPKGSRQQGDASDDDAVASAKGLRADEDDREDSDAKSASDAAGGKGLLVVSIPRNDKGGGVNNLT